MQTYSPAYNGNTALVWQPETFSAGGVVWASGGNSLTVPVGAAAKTFARQRRAILVHLIYGGKQGGRGTASAKLDCLLNR